MGQKHKVAYFYNNDYGNYYFGQKHPMKPHRICMTHHLVLGYDLHEHLDIYRSRRVDVQELAEFHAEDYIDFLGKVTPENQKNLTGLLKTFNMGPDCPVFNGLLDFGRLYSGGSIDGAKLINMGDYETVINWGGGLHHAKKAEASGFCYINDLVLAILELLRYQPRVLYIDIDIHHGDGVEEAFYLTDRVMTVSFHRYGEYNGTAVYFPGTGALRDIGEYGGRLYTVNVPLKEGIEDEQFIRLFKSIMKQVMESYRPTAIVMQCGADSLKGDKLGQFNLTVKGHGEAVKFMKSFGIPMLITGGGGYTKENVARCWAYETGCVLNQQLDENLPGNLYYNYFGPNYNLYQLRSAGTTFDNKNTQAELEQIQTKIFQNLKNLEYAPSVQMQYMPSQALVPQFNLDLVETQDRLNQYIEDHGQVRGEVGYYNE